MGNADLAWLDDLTDEQKKALLSEVSDELARFRLADYTPYPKQQEFHTAGANPAIKERLLMAGNQLGKTWSAANETAMHLTGLYPDWWTGATFPHATTGWAASETSQGTRDTVQRLLLGPPNAWGTGAIPADKIIAIKRSTHGVSDQVETIIVKHVSGKASRVTLKTYDQGRQRWQGETLDFVWFDEEPPLDIYIEGLTRTNATDGIVWTTFTPLQGMSDVVKRFLIDKAPGTHVTTMTIEDALHYTPEQRAAIIAMYPLHEREGRTKGIPTLGSGAVFPVAEDQIKIHPFAIPAYWPRIHGIDFGWDHPTGAVELAIDRDADIVYVTKDYRQRQAIPLIHATAIKAWGNYPVAWPHDGLQHDKGSGEQLADQYRKLGVKMLPERAQFEDGSFGVEAGIADMLERMQTGRWKVFSTCGGWLEEFRLYHRKDGLIVKLNDDAISASRYAYMMRRFARVNKPQQQAIATAFQPFDPAVGT